MKSPNLTLIEINEFNYNLLSSLAVEFDYDHIRHFMSLKKSDSICEQKLSENLLEPWIQWVSVHNGLTADEIQIRSFHEDHLQPGKQIWDQLEGAGIKTSVWNTFNSQAGEASVYFPLAWNEDQEFKPSSLKAYFLLNRYASLNYTGISFIKIIKLFIQFQGLLLKTLGFRWGYLKDLILLLYQTLCVRKILVPAGYLEDYGIQLWKHFAKKEDCQFHIVTLHLMAHLQHNHWVDRQGKKNKNVWRTGLHWLDKSLGIIRELNTEVMVLNGMEQLHISETQVLHYIYKLRNPDIFIQNTGIKALEIWPHMTSEYTIRLSIEEEASKAAHYLKQAKISSKPAFIVREYQSDLVCFRLNIYEDLEKGTSIQFEDKELNFYRYYSALGLETGSHSHVGCLLTNDFHFTNKTKLSNLKNIIVERFTSKA